jgi:hypothetical protein
MKSWLKSGDAIAKIKDTLIIRITSQRQNN